MFCRDATTVIESALSAFTKLAAQIEQDCEQCQTQLVRKHEKINELCSDCDYLNDAIDRGRVLADNLRGMVG
jgi:hypothetical protein